MKKKILLVTDRPRFSKRLIRYCLGLAKIMGYDVAALFVPGEGRRELAPRLFGKAFSFAGRAGRAAAGMQRLFSVQGVAFEHVLAEGSLSKAVEAFHRETKRVEFALIEVNPGKAAPVFGVTVPVHYFDRGLPFTGHRPGLPGLLREICNTRRIAMSLTTASSKRKHWGKAAVALAGSAGIYYALFANEASVTSYFTRGGLYSALPIATAFAFSFVYGTFAHSFWAALGIEAHRKTRVVETRKEPSARKDVRPRPTLSA